MHTTTVMCTMTQSQLKAATLSVYSKTPIDTSTIHGTLEGFYPHQAWTLSVYIQSHYHFKFEIGFILYSQYMANE